MGWPDGPRLFEYFRDLPGPLRLTDMPDYVRSLGFSPDPYLLASRTFQGTPMRHRRPRGPDRDPVQAGHGFQNKPDTAAGGARSPPDMRRRRLVWLRVRPPANPATPWA